MQKLNFDQLESLDNFKNCILEAAKLPNPPSRVNIKNIVTMWGLGSGHSINDKAIIFYVTGKEREEETKAIEEDVLDLLVVRGYKLVTLSAGNRTAILNETGMVAFLDIVTGPRRHYISFDFQYIDGECEGALETVESWTVGRGIEKVSHYRIGNNGLYPKMETVSTGSSQMDSSVFYPYLEKSPAELWKDFENSEANILFLYGPPGTGKTSFLKAMLDQQSWKNVNVIDDEKCLQDAGIASTLRDISPGGVMVIEDADNFVLKRENGNDAMSALLNIADGVVKTDAKFIISTNLPTTRDVDPALLRPGRLFAAKEFRLLDYDEARHVRRSMDLDWFESMPSDKSYWTLSEAINLYNDEAIEAHETQSFGFN